MKNVNRNRPRPDRETLCLVHCKERNVWIKAISPEAAIVKVELRGYHALRSWKV